MPPLRARAQARRRRRCGRRRPDRASPAPGARARARRVGRVRARAGRATSSSASSTIRRVSSSTRSSVAGEAGVEPGSRNPSCGPSAIASGPSSSLMPQRATIPRAILVRFWMSDSAPVVVSPYTTCSATRPPSATLILATSSSRAVAVPVGLRRRERHAERLPSRDDRDLAHGVGARREHPDERVARLVVGGALAVGVRHHDLALGAEDDLLDRVREVPLLDGCVAPPGREQRRLVHDQGEVGARGSRRRRRDLLEVDTGGKRHRARVNLEDLRAAGLVRRLDGDPAVETTRAQ